MRCLFLSLLNILLISFAASANPYFCVDEGTDLVYVRRFVDDGSIKWIHTMSIGKVITNPDSSLTVDYASHFTNEKGGEIMGGTIPLEAYIYPSGDVELDISASMVSAIKGYLWKNAKVTAEGGKTILPSSLEPGDSLVEAHGKVHALGMTMNVDVTERKVLRREVLTTPAGTFDCVVVSEHKVEKGMMRNRITTALTWYAEGIGMVRHDTYDKNLKLETSEILEKIIVKK